MDAHNLSVAEVISQSNTDAGKGLTREDVQKRLLDCGENKLTEAKKRPVFLRFLDQFKDTMIIILLIAAAISFFIAIREGKSEEFFEPILILIIVIANALMGLMQESKAEKAMDALKSLSAPHARVVRDGAEEVIDASGLVPGDIILVEAGDFVPADARLIESASLKSEESALTGESVPSDKDARAECALDAALGDRKNMIYSGCSITYGRARAVVTGTGMNSEMGKIAGLLQDAKAQPTPLQQKLAKLGSTLGVVALAACAVIFVIGLLNGMPVMEIFMTAVSLAVSAIPEGLPAVVTIVLSIGIQRMAAKNAIIRKLPAVETLGSASVICSDKTGTLTQNRMTLMKAYVCGEADAEDITDHVSENVKTLISRAALCCDGTVIVENGVEKHIGDPTETSIVAAAGKNGIEKEALMRAYPRVGELPFDSDRKLMTTIHNINGHITAITKGAYDVLVTRCIAGVTDKTDEMVQTMSENALRVLAIAVRTLDEVPATMDSYTLENDLTLIGLVGMIDPPRPEVRDAVKLCRRAGIKPVMITGDHVVTAAAIAKDLGILDKGDLAITGRELSEMTDEEHDQKVRSISVYARVSPEDKIRIVRAWQKQGEVVSMTGDGVNDAPALKAADIGCAMGITGTDVSKSAAAMTLTDDNFTTIVDAVREGRGIYNNIRKVVGFLLGTNIGEILCVFFAMILWRRTPLLSMQLLLVNLATDSLPAVALGMEPVETDVMDQKPRSKNESLFSGGYGIQIILQGMLFGALTLGAYLLGEYRIGAPIDNMELCETYGRTMAFIVLALSQVVQAFNMRSEHSLFAIGPFKNRKLNLAALSSFALVVCVLFIPPLQYVFGFAHLPAYGYLYALGLSLVPVPVMEIAKLFLNRRKRAR